MTNPPIQTVSSCELCRTKHAREFCCREYLHGVMGSNAISTESIREELEMARAISKADALEIVRVREELTHLRSFVEDVRGMEPDHKIVCLCIEPHEPLSNCRAHAINTRDATWRSLRDELLKKYNL